MLSSYCRRRRVEPPRRRASGQVSRALNDRRPALIDIHGPLIVGLKGRSGSGGANLGSAKLDEGLLSEEMRGRACFEPGAKLPMQIFTLECAMR